MIIVRTPLRIPLAGGGTDLDFYYKKKGADLISATFNQFIYVLISKRNLDKKILVQDTNSQFANDLKKLNNKLVKAALEYFKINESIQIASFSTLPTRSGLGSSSAFLVGIVKGLSKYKGLNFSKEKIARVAYFLERKKLMLDGGWQDQIVSSYGGIIRIKINKKGQFLVRNINSFKNIKKIEKNFLLVFTEETRDSQVVFKEQREKIENTIKRYDTIKSKVNSILKNIKNGNLENIGKLFHEHWFEKKKLSKKITKKSFNNLYISMIKSNFFYGGKLIGAGNGGFFLMVCKHKKKSVNFLKAKKINFINIKFDYNGSEILDLN